VRPRLLLCLSLDEGVELEHFYYIDNNKTIDTGFDNDQDMAQLGRALILYQYGHGRGPHTTLFQ